MYKQQSFVTGASVQRVLWHPVYVLADAALS